MRQAITALRALKLHGMAANLPEVAAQAIGPPTSVRAFLGRLLRAEQAERTVRSMAYQMGAARFPRTAIWRALNSARPVDEALVRTLHGGRSLTRPTTWFHRWTGHGQDPLATAIGIEAIQKHGKRVRFFSTVELVNALELEKSQGKAGQLAHRLGLHGPGDPG